ncbi:MAG: alanyl-tRNA editing protein [Myxococcales bacterium]|nr:alanyl-tRNA editing protein [Myxococcales bacterium]
MPTARLYFEDPLALEFEATVVAHGSHEHRPSLILDRSAFYPEGGGQLPDGGSLAGHPVVDVQVDELGVIHHVLAGALPDIGAKVQGTVDRGRRRRHMAEHTAQHVLSRALLEVAGAETLSARLGESACTIDVNRAELPDAELERAESLATAIVDDDLPVRGFFPTRDELAALPLRRAPKVEELIRIVSIGDFDFTPCGGTHCTHTAQIGLLRVVSTERYKGGTRVTFVAGSPARELLVNESLTLRALGKSFTCGPLDVGGAIEKLRRELDGARDDLGRMRASLAERCARELAAQAAATLAPELIARVDGANRALLASIAARITERPDAVAILAGSEHDSMPLFVARGAHSRFDCGAFVKRLARAAGGRGGGRPERAEGSLPLDFAFEIGARAALAG